MGWTKLGVLILFLIVIFTVSAICGHFGYEVDGVPQGGELEGEPGILGAMSWVWNAISWFTDMVTFQVDGMPYLINLVFIAMSLITVTIAVMIFWPGGSG